MRQATAPWTRRVAVLGIVVGVLAVLAMLLPGPLYRGHALALGAAFKLLGFGFYLGLLAAFFGLVGLLLALFGRPPRYRLLALAGLVLGAIAFVPPLLFMHKAKSVPPIHDISTDTANPPQFSTLLPKREAAPNGAAYGGPKVAAQQHAAYPDIKPMQFSNAPDNTFHAALSVARAMGWKVASQLPAKGLIEATATTAWFGFKDDVVIRLEPHDGGTRVDVRSESRVGGSDIGANAARIRAFREKLTTTLGHDRHI